MNKKEHKIVSDLVLWSDDLCQRIFDIRSGLGVDTNDTLQLTIKSITKTRKLLETIEEKYGPWICAGCGNPYDSEYHQGKSCVSGYEP